MTHAMNTNKNKSLLIFILGCMTALSPFSIDMYLPAFQAIAAEFGTTVARVSLSLSAYFVGLAGGQLFYGPLLDRFGRKRPLYAGLALYIIASLCCLLSKTTETLIVWRVLQAVGGCVAGVGSMAMVRDLFSMKESAKVYSLLILILGVSPLLAPTIGGFLSAKFGWQSVFIVLATMGVLLLFAVRFLLIESHNPDPTVVLKLGPIFKSFHEILVDPRFYTYTISGAVAFSGLFVYLAGSPVIFLETYKVGPTTYGWIFAFVAAGMIIASQFNVLLLRKFSNEELFKRAMISQSIVGVILSFGVYFDWLSLYPLIFVLFLFMGSFGLTNPNAGALALAPFSQNAGRASALLGFLQMGIGAVASMVVGFMGISRVLPIVVTIALTSILGLIILLWGEKRLEQYDKA